MRVCDHIELHDTFFANTEYNRKLKVRAGKDNDSGLTVNLRDSSARCNRPKLYRLFDNRVHAGDALSAAGRQHVRIRQPYHVRIEDGNQVARVSRLDCVQERLRNLMRLWIVFR